MITHRHDLFGAAAAFALLSAAANAQDDEPELDIRAYEAGDVCDPSVRQLRVTVDDIRTTEGILSVELYRNQQRGFLTKKGRLRRIREAAHEGSQTVCFNVDSEGPFAVATYHDQDGDRDLDQKWNRMPKEPFGLSNDPKLKFGFPPIEPSLVTVPPEGLDVVITLRGHR
ncbi:MAG: DUF2141 domain-containing protein [Pseudomonadota bacterium]